MTQYTAIHETSTRRHYAVRVNGNRVLSIFTTGPVTIDEWDDRPASINFGTATIYLAHWPGLHHATITLEDGAIAETLWEHSQTIPRTVLKEVRQ